MINLKDIIIECRLKQYTKNLLVFASPIFAGVIFNDRVFIKTIITYISFSLLASSVYVFNDIIDVEKDRLHPKKCCRPIASGRISFSTGWALAGILLLASFGLAAYVQRELLMVFGVYLILNILYSLKLKHIVIVDVMIIAIGFVLRAVAGVVATGTGTNGWFLMCIFMLSLFLALGKRRSEMVLFTDDDWKQRKVLKKYNLILIDQLLMIAATITITSYSIFALQTKEYICPPLGDIQMMIFTVPVVIYGIFRYLYLIYVKNKGGAPEDMLLKDIHILITCLMYGALIIIIRNT